MTDRCIDGRLFRHRPFFDDPDFEYDVGRCPDCDGKGCDEEGETCSDCPPVGYSTDKTRCLPCPRRAQELDPK
jgi:hypothetical protein